MKKIPNVHFILLLALLLTIVPAVIAIADGGSITGAVTLVAQGDSTAEWITEEVKFGDYSAKLTMPSGNWYVSGSNAEARIDISDTPTIAEITNWSFWTISPDSYTVPIELYVDTSGDGVWDTKIAGTTVGATPDGWFEVNEAIISCYMTWGGPYGFKWMPKWSDVQKHFGDAILIRVDLGYGPLGSTQAITAYVDDFILNGTTYVFEPPTKADILRNSGVLGKGLSTAPGLQKPFNPDSQAGKNAGKK